MQERNFEVTGMTCQGCVRAVTRAIQKADPQAEVQVTLEANHLKAQTSLSAAELQARIEGAGFTAKALV